MTVKKTEEESSLSLLSFEFSNDAYAVLCVRAHGRSVAKYKKSSLNASAMYKRIQLSKQEIHVAREERRVRRQRHRGTTKQVAVDVCVVYGGSVTRFGSIAMCMRIVYIRGTVIDRPVCVEFPTARPFRALPDRLCFERSIIGEKANNLNECLHFFLLYTHVMKSLK